MSKSASKSSVGEAMTKLLYPNHDEDCICASVDMTGRMCSDCIRASCQMQAWNKPCLVSGKVMWKGDVER